MAVLWIGTPEQRGKTFGKDKMSWNKVQNREIEEQSISCSNEILAWLPACMLTAVVQIFFCFTIAWFSLKALHMIESIETVPWPYISKTFFILSTYTLCILLRVWCCIEYATCIQETPFGLLK